MNLLQVAPDSIRWFRNATETLIDASSIAPGQIISAGSNTTGRTLLTPGNNQPGTSTYPAFWIRDPGWVAETGLIPADNIWGWITLMAETMQGHTARHLQSGGIIPPYSVPDHINVDGSPVFYPGTYRSDHTQGPPWGKYPPHDDQYWLVFNTYAYARLTGDWTSFLRAVDTSMGEMQLSQVCELAHNALPVDTATQLCIASSDVAEHIVDWGYNDSITKTGMLLFPSLLRYESAMKLAHLFERNGMPGEASTYFTQAHLLRRAIIATFYAEDEHHHGWLYSATGIGHQPDIWGTAYAIYLDLLPRELNIAAATYLLRSYQERTTVLDGQIRHLPTTVGSWEIAQCLPGTYQNGGYWGYAVGWYIYALMQVDQAAGTSLFNEYINYMRDTWDSTLRTCAWECFNPAMNHYQNPGYLATLAVPFSALIRKGLINIA